MTETTGVLRVGMVGGGQLSRMTAAPAAALGVGFRVLALDPHESAAQVAADVVLGRHDDLEALRRLADGATVVTFDHEHVPPEHLRALEASGVSVRPGPSALVHAQDKIAMREAQMEAEAQAPKQDFKVKLADAAQLDALMDSTSYDDLLKGL